MSSDAIATQVNVQRTVTSWRSCFTTGPSLLAARRGFYRAALLHPDRILWIFFEDLVADRLGAIRNIAEFIGLGSLPDLEARIAAAFAHSEFSFMKLHQHRFDDHLLKAPQHRDFQAVGSGARKINVGNTGYGREYLGPLLSAELDADLQTHLAAELGAKSYPELRTLAASSDRLRQFRPRAPHLQPQ